MRSSFSLCSTSGGTWAASLGRRFKVMLAELVKPALSVAVNVIQCSPRLSARVTTSLPSPRWPSWADFHCRPRLLSGPSSRSKAAPSKIAVLPCIAESLAGLRITTDVGLLGTEKGESEKSSPVLKPSAAMMRIRAWLLPGRSLVSSRVSVVSL